MKVKSENNTSFLKKMLFFVIVFICLVLMLCLIFNTILIVKSYTNPKKVPDVGGFIPLVVLSDSMAPEIKSGDLIILKEVDSKDIKVNDIITFFDPVSATATTVTHRVTFVLEKDNQVYFKTKGDNNDAYDDVLISFDSLIGVYCYKLSGFGNVAMFMSTTKGLVLCVILPFILLVGYDVAIKKRKIKRYNEDKEYLLSEIERLKSDKDK